MKSFIPLLLTAASAVLAATDKRPSVVFIFADDHDARTESIKTMPHTQKLLVKEGLYFEHFFSPISVCCPSRASFFRAQAPHSHNVTYLWRPYGGWEVACEKGLNGHYLPTYLQEAGYSTRYVGKFMNDHTTSNYIRLAPKHWTEAEFLLDPNTYDYWNATFTIPGSDKLDVRLGEYSTDVVAEKGLRQLERAAKEDKPFFLTIAPVGPHGHIPYFTGKLEDAPHNGKIRGHAPRSAPRHQHLFNDVYLDKSRESFNPDRPSGASWVKELPKLNQTNLDYLEYYQRQRLRALQAVDELVGGVVNKLEELGILDNTYIIYSADNGYETSGRHRRQPGKTLPYEEDIRVPLVIRGPGVPKGAIDSNSAYNLIDLGATILSLAGAKTEYENDGAIIPITEEQRKEKAFKQVDLAEFWAEGITEGKYAGNFLHVNNTYRAVRVIEDEINYSYAVWCTGEHEIYDLSTDPDQMHNLAEPTLHDGRTPPPNLPRLRTRFNGLLLALKECSGDECRNPWGQIFPRGEVKSFKESLDKKFDTYFGGLPQVRYSTCAIGYHRVLEAPFWERKLGYGAGSSFLIQN